MVLDLENDNRSFMDGDDPFPVGLWEFLTEAIL